MVRGDAYSKKTMPSKRKNILLITTADTDILTAESALAGLPRGFARLTAINPSLAVTQDDQTKMVEAASKAGVVVLRLLGGKQAMPEVFDPLVEACHERGIPLIACPGHEEWDQDLVSACSVPPAEVDTVFSYLIRGGVQNFHNLFLFLSDAYLGTAHGHEAPAALPWEGVYHPLLDDGFDPGDIDSYVKDHLKGSAGSIGQVTVGILFYRAHWMSGNLRPIDALIHRLEALGANVLPVFSYSLKHNPEDGGDANPTFTRFLTAANGVPRVHCVINTMAMSMSELTSDGESYGAAIASPVDYLETLDVPMIQGIISTGPKKEWLESSLGLGPIDTAMNVALPEFDGRLITVPISFKEERESAPRRGLKAKLQQYVPLPDRVDLVARLAVKWANLRLTSNAEKRIAIILSNYPTKDARIGNAVGLDTPASVIHILHALKKAGYKVDDIPESADALIHSIIERCSNDVDSLTEEQLRLAVGHVSAAEYGRRFDAFPTAVKDEMKEAWGDPPGRVYRTGDRLAIAGIQLGNIFVGVQPPRGFGENPIAIYHSPDLAPTHHYLAYYQWVREIFKADAMVHVGKHGTLEWLPGKGIGLSNACYPEVALDDMPLFYPFIINNPGEGAQAKRRAHAAIIDHLIPAMTSADSYGDIAKLEQLMDEHYQCQTLDPGKLPLLEQQIWELTKEAELNRDLGIYDQPEDFGGFILEIDGYLCELKDAQIKDGLHTLGEIPAGQQLVGLMSNLTRLQNSAQIPSLRGALAQALGLDYGNILENPGTPVNGGVPGVLAELDIETPARTQGDLLERLETLARLALTELLAKDFQPSEVPEVVRQLLGRKSLVEEDAPVLRILSFAAETVYPALLKTPDEIDNLIKGLDGRFVPPGPSGAPTRGMANILPTGRNFYSVDPKTIPSPAAWETGEALAAALLQKYIDEEGAYPEMVGLVVWGTSAMRTHGDDVAQILSLLGVRPVWQAESRRVMGLEVIPLEELGRPRIDVTVRISGFFRDAFPNLINLLDQAIELVASLDEPPEDNLVVKHLNQDLEEASPPPTPILEGAGGSTDQGEGVTRSASLYRIFGSKPGTYGAGILPVIEERNWETVNDLAEVYTAWGGYAYTQQEHGVNARQSFRKRFSQIVVAAKNQDNREHDIFDSDDYMQYHGGMIATVRALTGRNPRQFFGDSADPSRSRVRDLQDEARRVFRTRVVNPKWIDSMKRHGYKGAFELAATVDYMFGYDATAQVVEDWMYQGVTESYVLDPETRDFFQQSNPWALKSVVERLLEAIQRGMWENPPPDMRQKLEELYLQLEADLEARQEMPHSAEVSSP
jgi:cobaltochelatase CobN